MSYEGYEQGLCAKGHYHHWDCNDVAPKKCLHKGCKEKIVWWNAVDLTNGSYDLKGKTRIDNFVRLKTKHQKICKCKECGNVHNIETTYYIPKKKGHRI